MNIGIVGYGKMGTGIFRLLAGKDFGVVVCGRDRDKCLDCGGKYFKSLARAAKRGRISERQYLEKRRSIHFTARYEDLADCDLVVETAAEDYAEKLKIFHALEANLRPDAVLVTNSSSLSVATISQELNFPERFCGLHFFYPVVLIDLVEIIQTADTKPSLTDFLRGFCKSVGKKSIAVQDAPGSVINAILAYYYIEALFLLEQGNVSPSRIDQLAKRFFYVGPCESLDVIGIDFFVDALKRLATSSSLSPVRWGCGGTEAMGREIPGCEGFYVPELLQRMLLADRFGRKASKGIYRYERDKPFDDEPAFYRTTEAPYSVEHEQDDATIEMRLLYAVYNGCLTSLVQGMADPDDIDLGVREILQMRKGPLELMQATGRREIEKGFDFLNRTVGGRFDRNPVSSLWHRVFS